MIFSKLNVTLLLNKLFFFQRERKTNFQEYFVRLWNPLSSLPFLWCHDVLFSLSVSFVVLDFHFALWRGTKFWKKGYNITFGKFFYFSIFHIDGISCSPADRRCSVHHSLLPEPQSIFCSPVQINKTQQNIPEYWTPRSSAHTSLELRLWNVK